MDRLSEMGLNCAKAIYEYPVPTAYVRFHEGVQQTSRVVTSKEIFHILKDCGTTVKLVQTFVPQRAKETSYRLVCDYMNIFGAQPPQFIMQRERSTIAKQKESIVSSPLAGKTIRGGGRAHHEREDDDNPLDRITIRSFDTATNQVIQSQMRTLV